MNKLTIIGNLTRNPEYKDVNGIPCATFTVAVNRRVKNGAHPEADYVRVTAWRKLADVCASYLQKGKKVYVEGRATASAWAGNDGTLHANIDLTATDVEFLSPRDQTDADPEEFTEVPDDESVPFN